jgi:hypothetical protein
VLTTARTRNTLFGGSGSDDHFAGPGVEQVFMGDDVEGKVFDGGGNALTPASWTLGIRPSTAKRDGWIHRDAY